MSRLGKTAEGIFPANDPELVTEILNKAFLTVAETYGYTSELVPDFPAFIGAGVIAGQIQTGLSMYCFRREDRALGCAGYSKQGGIFVIERLAVLPEYRHKGIGKALLDFLENKIAEESGSVVEVGIVDNNNVLKAWYKKLGYAEIKTEEYPRLPFRVCVLQKTFL